MNPIGKPAPQFNSVAVINGAIAAYSSGQLAGRYSVILFYPLDFTFVCPTELHAFQEQLPAFKSRNAEVIAVSVDSAHSHLAWLNTPKAAGGIAGITFPLVSDITKKISESFGVLDEAAGIALRGLFILDKTMIVQHASINNLALGRSVHEVLRLIDALQHHEKHGEVCPANWTRGARALKPTRDSVREYLATT